MRLEETFRGLKKKGEGALIGYITLGDPSPPESFAIAQSLIDSGGVDILELGVPFSDPIADGPVIQAAVDRSLKAGMNTDLAFEIAAGLDKKVPIVYLTYYNIVLQRGIQQFMGDCEKAGVSGVIIADLPFEESAEVREACKTNGVDYINIVTPNTSAERMRMILADASGFVYVVSNMGVTGAHAELPSGLKDTVRRALESANGLPVAVGFGISSPGHVHSLMGMGVSGAIVGSAIVDKIGKGSGKSELCEFTSSLKAATRAEYPEIKGVQAR
ncbi:MAG TPA: tryptophan synthase subunit alpha [Methanocella sp.]|nr:tryptophan synthase subunit alpha [Methanocella sp.]